MNLALAAALAAIALAAMAALALGARRRGGIDMRTLAAIVLQPVLATLLYFVLQPPPSSRTGGDLHVLAAGTTDAPSPPRDARVVALPEAGAPAGIARVPDLATALRRHPATVVLQVHGDGLPARDQAAAAGRALRHLPGPAPQGLVALDWPTTPTAGTALAVRGTWRGEPVTVELRDPADRVLATATPGADGGFALATIAGPAGPLELTLRLAAADGSGRGRHTLPLQVQAGASLRLRVLAGAPSPELKHLRRWALDAGLPLHTQVSVGGGIELGDAPRPVTAATLAETDLLLLDERAWRALGAGGRDTVLGAVREGLGVLLLPTGPLAPAEREALAALGLAITPAPGDRGVVLPGQRPLEGGTGAPVPLTRRPEALQAPAGGVLLRTAGGGVLAAWQPLGEGRLGAWLLADSHRLVLAGQADLHGALWSRAVATLARPRATPAPRAPTRAWAGERTIACGSGELRALAPDGTTVPLPPDPRAGAGCAGYWPQAAGWHALAVGDARTWLLVLDPADWPGLHREQVREATAALAATSPPPAEARPVPGPGDRRTGWAAFLAAFALAAWLERRRRS